MHHSHHTDLWPTLPRNRFLDPCVMSLRGVGLLGGKKRDYSTWSSWTCLANPLRPTPVHVATRHRLCFTSHFSQRSSTEVQNLYVTRGDGWWQSYELPVVCYLSSRLMWHKLWSHSSVVLSFFSPQTIVVRINSGALGEISPQRWSDIYVYTEYTYIRCI